MFYVRRHAIDRYIERIEALPRNVAKNNILEAMLFSEKKAIKRNYIVYLKEPVIVITIKENNDINAITTMNINKLDPKKNRWWQKILINKENDNEFKKEI